MAIMARCPQSLPLYRAIMTGFTKNDRYWPWSIWSIMAITGKTEAPGALNFPFLKVLMDLAKRTYTA